MGSRIQNRSFLGTQPSQNPESRTQERQGEARGSGAVGEGVGVGGAKDRGETPPSPHLPHPPRGREADACALPHLAVLFYLLWKDMRHWGIWEMEEESGESAGHRSLGVPTYSASPIPSLRVDRVVTPATQTSLRDQTLQLGLRLQGNGRRLRSAQRDQSRRAKCSSGHILFNLVSNIPQLASPNSLENYVIFLLSSNLHDFLPHPYFFFFLKEWKGREGKEEREEGTNPYS